jgi:hypothetical protein
VDTYPLWLFGGPGTFGLLTGLMLYKSQLLRSAITRMQRPDHPYARTARLVSGVMLRSGYLLLSLGLAELCLGLAFATNISQVVGAGVALALVLALTGLVSLIWQPRWLQPSWVRELGGR